MSTVTYCGFQDLLRGEENSTVNSYWQITDYRISITIIQLFVPLFPFQWAEKVLCCHNACGLLMWVRLSQFKGHSPLRCVTEAVGVKGSWNLWLKDFLKELKSSSGRCCFGVEIFFGWIFLWIPWHSCSWCSCLVIQRWSNIWQVHIYWELAFAQTAVKESHVDPKKKFQVAYRDLSFCFLSSLSLSVSPPLLPVSLSLSVSVCIKHVISICADAEVIGSTHTHSANLCEADRTEKITMKDKSFE